MTIIKYTKNHLFLWACVFLFILSMQYTFAQETHHVLVLNSYHKGFKGTDGSVRAIEDVFRKSQLDIELSIEYMDTKRTAPTDEYLQALADLYKMKYKDHQPQVIITTDNNALYFAVRYHDELFPGSPIAFSGVNNYHEDMLQDDPLITGVVEEPDIAGTLQTMVQMHPDAQKILVICDVTKTGKENARIARQASLRYQGQIEFEYLCGDKFTFEEILQRLGNAPSDNLVILLDFYYDKTGRYFDLEKTIPKITATSTRPVYVHHDILMDMGTIGGKIATSYLQGETVAAMAERILKGTPVQNIPVLETCPTAYTFEAPLIKKFNIDQALLPPGSILLHQQQSFFQTYKRLVQTSLLIFLLMTVAIVILSFSIRKRRLAEKSAKRQKDLLTRVINHIPHAVWWIDSEGNLAGANKTFIEILKLQDAACIIGQPAKQIINQSGTLGKEFLQNFQEIEQTNAEAHPNEIRMKTPSGEIIFLFYKMLLRDSNGEFFGILGIAHNVTQRRRLEEELNEARKMEAIGQLAGGVAHDFNNLLAAICGNAELLNDIKEIPQRDKKLIHDIQKAGHRAADLTNQLLTFARRGHLQLAVIDIRDIIEETVRLLSHSINKIIRIHFQRPSAPIYLRADSTRLQTALLNLAINARDAIEGAGNISFDATVVELQKKDIEEMQTELLPGEYCHITVKDDGKGMTPEETQRIFEPFFTTKEVGKGTGLGLSVVYGAIQSHNGAIIVESQPGSGTTFQIYLPGLSENIETKPTAPLINERNNAANILVVDDEQIVAQMTKRSLERAGYIVTACYNTSEAIETLKQNPERFQIAIIDVIMPDMNGIQLVEEARPIAPKMQYLLMSGYSEESLRQQYQNRDIPPLVQKPFKPSQLVKIIGQMIKQQQSS